MALAPVNNMSPLPRMSERTFGFACRLIDEYRQRRPSDDAERIIWTGLLKAGTSIGANSSESDGAQTDKDFIAKFQISLKEGRESLFWLRLLKHASPDRASRVALLYKE